MDWWWWYTDLATTVTGSEPLDYHVWSYMKVMVIARKVNTKEKLLQRISALQEASTTLLFFIRVQVCWSHESENASKQMEDTFNNLLEC
jgi:hypothetical protein